MRLLCGLQEVSSTAERAEGQLEEVEGQLERLGKSGKDVYFRTQIFKSKVRRRGPKLPPADQAKPADAAPSTGASNGAVANGATAKGTAPGGSSPDGATPKGVATSGEDKNPIVGGVMAITEEYDEVETVQVLLTVDHYHEVMRGVLASLQGEVARLKAIRDDVNATFAEMVAYFGERPQGVKEQEWWGDVIKFLKALSKSQTALQKERDAARALAEKRSKQAQQAPSKAKRGQ
jgi:hypothetical protein